MVTALDATNWLGRFDTLVAELGDASVGVTQSLCALGRSKLDGAEARALAAQVPADGDTRRAARMAGRGGKRSKAAARKAAGRARAVAKNETLADDMDSGRLSPEQVDLIAGAMDTDESAATDQELIDAVAGASVDQGRKIARDWQTRNTTRAAAESEHRRQRRLRAVRRYLNKANGLDTILFEGDKVTIDEISNALEQRERQLHDADGGRDLPRDQHRRTRDHRLFDALHDLVTGVDGTPAARPSAVLAVPVDPNQCPELIGHGPISDSAARQLLARAGLSVMLINELTGEPLWLSRNARHASAAQFLALVIRDGGCVQCGAVWVRCHAHHLTPYNAPARGETNIDELALVCPSCHHQLHNDQLTLIRKPDGTWGTRAALDHELPPNRPTGPRSAPHRRTRHEHPVDGSATTAPPGRRRTPPGHPPRADTQINPALFDQPGVKQSGDDDQDTR